MMPEETAQAAQICGQKRYCPVMPDALCWLNIRDDPYKRLALASRHKAYRLLTPMQGEPVKLDDPAQPFTVWWERTSHLQERSSE